LKRIGFRLLRQLVQLTHLPRRVIQEFSPQHSFKQLLLDELDHMGHTQEIRFSRRPDKG
jgi:hypothetical protein